MQVKHSWRGIELQSCLSSEIISERKAQELIFELEQAIEKEQDIGNKTTKGKGE